MISCHLPEEDREIWSQRCVAYETNESEAGVDLVMIQTSLLFLC